VAQKPRFTRIPKVEALVLAGVPTEAIPTYCALADYANNKTGLCWPKMETLAIILGRSVRTVQRHLHLLKELGLIEFVERRRQSGRFSSYLYKVIHIVRTTTGHGRRAVRGDPIYRRTKRSVTPPNSPPREATAGSLAEAKSQRQNKRTKESKTRDEVGNRRSAKRAMSGYSSR
jgi:DNA-binding transcriptional ArsR family regulator